jgi:Protein of unknown function DUF262/HNH endonuclease
VNIDPKTITVGELFAGYDDKGDDGVRAYNGKLDVRPPYQREFVYKDKQRDAVIDTLRKDYPLNLMYWAVRDDGSYEIIDGQQRTISICQFVEGDFSFEKRYFDNLEKDEKEQVLSYPLTVYLCSGTDSEKLAWFETINIAGLELTKQELRNAVYAGPWVTDAKRHFSSRSAPAIGLGGDYMSGASNRQAYLETVIKWISEDGDVDGYMATHQNDPDAHDLWLYFQAVIAWVKASFSVYRKKEMTGLPWGELYNEFKDTKLDPKKLEDEIKTLMIDDDVSSTKGIYAYVLTRNEKTLSLRTFTEAEKRQAYERQNGLCANETKCLTPGNSDGKQVFDSAEMEADHIKPWSKGGKTNPDNCQMLCLACNRQKGAI